MKAYAKLQELENNLLGQAAGRGGIAGKDVLKQCFYFYNVHLCQGVHQYFFILDVQGIADFGQGGRAGRGSGKRLLFQAAGREAENAGQSRNIRENIARLIHGGKPFVYSKQQGAWRRKHGTEFHLCWIHYNGTG